MSDSGEQNWWADYFDHIYLRIYEPLLSPAETDREVAAIRELLGERKGTRILDVPCGWGRHAVELARCGFSVTGVDQSAVLLSAARRRADEAGTSVRLVRSDMRELPFTNEFEAALCLFSSLGYFDEEGDFATLAAIRTALEPHGVLLIETMHRDGIAREFVERDWWATPTGEIIWVEREFDAVAGVSHEVLRWRDPSGAEGEKRHSIRIRSASEWDALLRRAGFAAIEWFGDWSLEPFDLGSERLIVLCGRG